MFQDRVLELLVSINNVCRCSIKNVVVVVVLYVVSFVPVRSSINYYSDEVIIYVCVYIDTSHYNSDEIGLILLSQIYCEFNVAYG